MARLFSLLASVRVQLDDDKRCLSHCGEDGRVTFAAAAAAQVLERVAAPERDKHQCRPVNVFVASPRHTSRIVCAAAVLGTAVNACCILTARPPPVIPRYRFTAYQKKQRVRQQGKRAMTIMRTRNKNNNNYI